MAGIARWPLSWLADVGVVCYERAAGRIRDERGGCAGADFMRSIVKTVELPTALASDNYILVFPGGGCPRYMTVEEVARCMGVDDCSPLMRMLSSPLLTPLQALACLGRGIHVGVARRVVHELVARGLLRNGCRYGSACSGIDMFAAGVEAEVGTSWRYMFASESCDRTCSALCSAWRCRGLAEVNCFTDAGSDAAASAVSVDLWVYTPTVAASRTRSVTAGGMPSGNGLV